jgi:hypothetical protein
MKKKISTLALAAVMAVSMNAFAAPEGKSCSKDEAKQCQKKGSCDKKEHACDKTKCEKPCDKKSEQKAS